MQQDVSNQIIEHGLIALRKGQYEIAIEQFSTVVSAFEENWLSRYYLAGALEAAGRKTAARHEFLFIAERCRDSRIRGFAQQRLKKLCLEEERTLYLADPPPWLDVLRGLEQGSQAK